MLSVSLSVGAESVLLALTRAKASIKQALHSPINAVFFSGVPTKLAVPRSTPYDLLNEK